MSQSNEFPQQGDPIQVGDILGVIGGSADDQSEQYPCFAGGCSISEGITTSDYQYSGAIPHDRFQYLIQAVQGGDSASKLPVPEDVLPTPPEPPASQEGLIGSMAARVTCAEGCNGLLGIFDDEGGK